MTVAPLLPDQDAREQALDIRGSYIVQAPAGSGKTELLSLRFLKLLAHCRQPEELLAITFTRKAAAEMADRIVRALQQTREQLRAGSFEPESPLARKRLEICQKVLEQDALQHWQLLANPARLRIQTIDSFCLSLARQLPVLSRLGGNPGISEDVSPCFADAISNTLAMLEDGTDNSRDIAALLRHLDNDVGKAERLLENLLAQRDQWLSHILAISRNYATERDYLQGNLQELIDESLAELAESLQPFADELARLADFAAGNLGLDRHAVEGQLPDAVHGALPGWVFIVELLVTGNDTWRRQVNVKNGFPASDKQDKAKDAELKQAKQDMSALLDRLRDDESLRELLGYVRLLPDPSYAERHWDFIASLCRVLLLLSSQLQLSFRRFRVVDYPEIGAAARTALGSDESPTDLALALDYRLQHILVDEFQDTSQLQWELLKQLTAGWQPGDGRSLFLVGDPMQSCYGFRNANVGIFLGVQEHGLGTVHTEPLTLSSNFRSHARVVDWVNGIFTRAFPAQPNPSRGAVAYASSTSRARIDSADGVRARILVHAQGEANSARLREAREIAAHIGYLRTAHPGQSIAVLVRNRSHLRALLPVLRAAGIRWQSTDIDSLATLPAIEDLLNLLRAVVNPADRLAWLAILRAPWCGLRSADLLALCQTAGDRSLWWVLSQPQPANGLSDDAARRLQPLTAIMGYGLRFARRVSLRRLLEVLWKLLRGEQTLNNPAEADSIQAFFGLLEAQENAGALEDLETFAENVRRKFIPARRESVEDASLLHILTMHKAKGLEFDHVILPGLAAQPRRDDKALLLWHERLNRQRDLRLFIAALSAAGQDDDPLYKLLRFEKQRKLQLENTRLLYIAVTRAKRSVTLLATLGLDKAGEVTAPPGTSLLNCIWDELLGSAGALEFLPLDTGAVAGSAAPVTSTVYPCPTPIRRFPQPLSLDRELITLLQPLASQDQQPESPQNQPPDTEPTENALAALCGKLLHRALQAYVTVGDALLQSPRWERLQSLWRRELQRQCGDAKSQEETIAGSVDFICRSLRQSVGDARYQWVFDPAQTDSSCELALESSLLPGRSHAVIDRSFVDAKGVRWIIDYKTAAPSAGQSETQFIELQQARYREQLKRYAELFGRLEDRPVKTALFLTALPYLVELE